MEDLRGEQARLLGAQRPVGPDEGRVAGDRGMHHIHPEGGGIQANHADQLIGRWPHPVGTLVRGHDQNLPAGPHLAAHVAGEGPLEGDDGAYLDRLATHLHGEHHRALPTVHVSRHLIQLRDELEEIPHWHILTEGDRMLLEVLAHDGPIGGEEHVVVLPVGRAG